MSVTKKTSKTPDTRWSQK